MTDITFICRVSMKDSEHVQYEYNMMVQTYRNLKLICERDTWDDGTLLTINIAHESFCVHAYNLFTYFKFKGKKVNRWKKLIRDQVLTLSDKRTAVMSEKIDQSIRKEIHDTIVNANLELI